MRRLALLLVLCAVAVSAAECPSRETGPNASVEGSLSATSCRLNDVYLYAAKDVYAARYRVTVANEGVLAVNLKSSEFKTALYLLTEQGSFPIATGQAAGDQNDSHIAIILAPGVYTILAAAKTAATGGAFVLTTSLGPRRTCSVADIRFDETVNGTLYENGCRMLDLIKSGSSDESYNDLYRFRVTSRSEIVIDMSSPDFQTWLGIVTAEGAWVTSAKGISKASRIVVSLVPGWYFVVANSGDVATGSYTLRVGARDLRACPTQALEPGATVDGALKDSTCRVLDVFVPGTDATYIDRYRITVTKRAIFTMEMNSTVFDTYLFLTTNLDGDIDSSDDIDRENTDSRIVTSLAPGTYYLYAGSSTVATGAYKVSLKVEDPRDCPVTDLAGGDSVSGRLARGGCRIMDVLAPSGDDSAVDLYKVTVDRKGQLAADLSSSDFDPYLALTDKDYEYVMEGEYGDDWTSVGGKVLLPPASYYLFASSNYKFGAYTLKTEFKDPPACTLLETRINSTVGGDFQGADCTLRDILPLNPSATPVRAYRITTPTRGTLRAVVKSAQESYFAIYLMNDAGLLLAPDPKDVNADPDDVSAVVDPGTYTLLVSPFWLEESSFTLATTFQASR